MKIVSVERQESFCYVAISKGGRVGVYSGDLRLLQSYEVVLIISIFEVKLL